MSGTGREGTKDGEHQDKAAGRERKGGLFDKARRRYCHFCKEKIDEVDYKDLTSLRRFVGKGARSSRPAPAVLAGAISARSPSPSSALARWRFCRMWSRLRATAREAVAGLADANKTAPAARSNAQRRQRLSSGSDNYRVATNHRNG